MPRRGNRILPDLATPALPGSRIAVNIGKTGSGKTSVALARYFTFPRVIAVDAQADRGLGEYPGWPVRTLDELRSRLEALRRDPPRDAQGVARWRLTYRGPTHVTPPGREFDRVSDANPLFDVLAEVEDVLVVVEEASNFTTDRKAPTGLERMALKGRRRGQALTLNTQRPALLSKTLLSQAQLVVAWPMQDPGDREALRFRNFPLDVLDGLEGNQSVRLQAPEGELPAFYVCRCRTPHSEVCGDPLPGPAERTP